MSKKAEGQVEALKLGLLLHGAVVEETNRLTNMTISSLEARVERAEQRIDSAMMVVQMGGNPAFDATRLKIIEQILALGRFTDLNYEQMYDLLKEWGSNP